jgi:hypothetical protein
MPAARRYVVAAKQQTKRSKLRSLLSFEATAELTIVEDPIQRHKR